VELTFPESRVLAAMIEKAMTTPANYPMSLNAVVVACNQVSNREPVTDFGEAEVELVLRGLTDEGIAKMVHKPGDRVVKYRHALDERLGTNQQETALLAVLMLRGAQTPGELRQRTGRYIEFSSLAALESVLVDLSRRDLVRRLERQPGQKEFRYEQLLTEGAPTPQEPDLVAAQPMVRTPAGPAEPDEMAELRAAVTNLERRFGELLDRLGEEIE